MAYLEKLEVINIDVKLVVIDTSCFCSWQQRSTPFIVKSFTVQIYELHIIKAAKIYHPETKDLA
jgi:hypothetical protein